MESSADLQRGLCKTDKAKLDEYFQGVREIENRLSKEEQWLNVPLAKPPLSEPKPGIAGKRKSN